MTEIDLDRVGKLIGSLRDAVDLLRELKELPEAEFTSDRHKQSSAKYNFISAIEAAIDLASHLISRMRLRAPEDYADTFRVLRDAGILEEEFTAELVKMARFRNRLVHIYWDVDVAELWRILQTRLGEFDKFVSVIGQFLSRSSE